MYGVKESLIFSTWQELHAASAEHLKATGARIADAVVVAVQDRMHCEVVLAFAEQGYDLLCEKPMATSVEDCVRMADAVKNAGIIFGMGHGMCPCEVLHSMSGFNSYSEIIVLRYSPYSKAMSEVIHSGSLGKLINIQHLEPIGYYHFAHSYVRGAWGKEAEASFSLMTKSSQ